MSIIVLSRVLEHSEATLGARLVLIALAEFAHDDGSRAFPSVETLGRRTRMSRRSVQMALRKLEEEGEIEQSGKSPAGTNVYRVLTGTARADSAGGAVDDAAGAQNLSSGGAADAPNPSENRHREPSEKKRADAREHPLFGEWIGHHHSVTDVPVLRAGSAGRKKVAGMFAARVDDGLSLDDLKAATVGAFADEFRREHGYFDPESVLRPTKVTKLVAQGRRAMAAAAAAPAETVDWSRFDD